jgi:hypothetical protein
VRTNVAGGTGAGSEMHRRTVPKEQWTCTNDHKNPGFAVKCLSSGCRDRRPT